MAHWSSDDDRRQHSADTERVDFGARDGGGAPLLSVTVVAPKRHKMKMMDQHWKRVVWMVAFLLFYAALIVVLIGNEGGGGGQ